MRLQTDLEFQQNEIKRLKEKCNVEMFSSRVQGRKTYDAEQKIRVLKKLLFKSKKVHKASSGSKRLDPKKLIQKAKTNRNVRLQKYGYPPKGVEENAVKSETFRDVYNFFRLFKVKEHGERYTCADTKKGKSLCEWLREPLKIGERVLALAKSLKKKDAPAAHIYKPTKDSISFFI